MATETNSIHNWHLGSLLDRIAESRGDFPFVIGANGFTYAEAASWTRKVANWFRRVGVKRGDRVMIVTANRAEAALVAFSAARIGAIFTIINNSVRAFGLQKILEQCEPAIVVLDETSIELASVIDGSTIIWAGNCALAEDGRRLDEIVREPDPGALMFPGIDLDPVCLIYTSGSTGEPRGVVVSHDNIRFSLVAIQERLCYKAEDIVGLFLPMSFDYGLYQVFLTAQVGASIFIGRPEIAGPELVSMLTLHKVTILPGVPTLFVGMLKLLNRRAQWLPHLRCITNTGDHFPQKYINKILHHLPKLQIFLMYGLTECKRVSILRSEELEERPNSVGRPLAGTEAYVVGGDGKRLPPGAIGELVVRGRHVTLGYWKASEETTRRFRQDHFGTSRELHTGDYCRMDQDGFLYFFGRKDHLLKHKGFRISPIEIEDAVCRIEGIIEAGVVKSEDDDQLHLFIAVVTQGITRQDVLKELRKRLERFKVPENVYTVGELPKTNHGKLDREKLRKQVNVRGRH